MKRIIYSIVFLIGVGCFGIGLSSVSGYLAGKHYVSRWLGDTPMAFSTAVVITFIGVALYLIGQTHLHNDETIRKI